LTASAQIILISSHRLRKAWNFGFAARQGVMRMAALARVPRPKGTLIGGQLAEFSRGRLEFFTRCAREHGDIVAFRLGPRRCLLISHPDYIEQVLVTESKNFRKHFGLRLNRLLLGNGLVSSDGKFWLRQRRLAQPAFLRERIASYGKVMLACTEQMLAEWRDGQTRDLHAEMTQLTLDIVAESLFGANVRTRARDVGDALQAAIASYQTRLQHLILLPEWVPTPANLRLRRAVHRLDKILYRIIRHRRGSGEHKNDLLSMLLHAQDDQDGSRMTDRQLRDEAMTLFLAGHETTALALSWTWYLLAQHPAIAGRLRDELRRVLGGSAPTPAHLPLLRYAERVIQESMRLYPPVYAIAREPIHDCEIGGCQVPSGTTIFMSQWVVHRDPRFFSDPECFRPERWAREQAASIPKFAYFPFGGGARTCIGNTFAMMEAVLILATVAQRFQLALLPGPPVTPKPFVTLRPARPMDMRLERLSTKLARSA
jgi:cytochrome P450